MNTRNQQLTRKICSAANEFASQAGLAKTPNEIRAAFEALFETWQDVDKGFLDEEGELDPNRPDRPEEFEGQDALRQFMGKDEA